MSGETHREKQHNTPARPQPRLALQGSAKIALIGAGAQGRTAAVCLHQLLPAAGLTVADISAHEPFVKAGWIPEGCLTLAMGSYQQTEDRLILGSDRIVVDCWGQAEHRGELKLLVEAGQVCESDIAAELGYIVAGTKQGRTGPQERIMAVLVGLGAHDVYIAGQVYQRAIATGRGQRVCLRHSEESAQ